jgi:hypothetical protein
MNLVPRTSGYYGRLEKWQPVCWGGLECWFGEADDEK